MSFEQYCINNFAIYFSLPFQAFYDYLSLYKNIIAYKKIYLPLFLQQFLYLERDNDD